MIRITQIVPAIVQTIAVIGLCTALGEGSDTMPASVQIFGEKLTFVVTAAETNGASVTFLDEVPPGGGPPAHIHTREDETFVTTRGHFRFWHGTHVIDAMPGTVVYMPRNEPHQFLNVGSTPGELVITIVPSGLERMFLAIATRKLVVPKDQAEIVRLGAEYGITYVPPLAPQTTGQ